MSRKFDVYLFWIVCGLCALSVVVWPLGKAGSRDLFYLASFIALLGLIPKIMVCIKSAPLIVLAMFLFGLYRVLHYCAESFFFVNYEISDSFSTGQRLLAGSVLLSYLALQDFRVKARALDVVLPLAILVFFGVSVCNVFIQDQGRAGSSEGYRATMFAYAATMIFLCYLGTFLQKKSKSLYGYLVLLVCLFLTAATVIMCSTRMAMITLFIASPLMVVMGAGKQRFKLLAGLIAILLVVGSIGWSSHIRPRFSEAVIDVQGCLQERNCNQSIGAKFEMWRGSWLAFSSAPVFGPGWHGRKAVIESAIASGKVQPVASAFIYVHMHNELIEEASLRGLVGIGLLLFFYFSIARYVFRKGKNYLAIFGVLSSCILFGLPDVLFMSREITVLIIVLLALLVSRDDQSPTADTRCSQV